MTTASGLQITDRTVGTGASPKPGQICVMHYTGWLYENGQKGKKFDSSVDRNEPFEFPIGQRKVIAGWDEGVSTMKVGGKRTLIIPPALGYGARGAGGAIPPNATLMFDVELLDVKAKVHRRNSRRGRVSCTFPSSTIISTRCAPLDCFGKLAGHDVTIWNDHVQDVDLLAERLRDTEALVLIRERTQIRAPLLERLPKLKLISPAQRLSPHRHRRLHPARASSCRRPARGYPILRHRRIYLGLVLAAMRAIPQQMAALKAGKWQIGVGHTRARQDARHLRLWADRRVVAGYGKAFGMKVLVWAREPADGQSARDGYETASDKAAFFEQCDVLSLHMRLVDATRGIVTAADLARMKPTALLVNTSRAPLIERTRW